MTVDPLPPLPPLPEAMRAGLPAEVQAYLSALEGHLATLAARLAELEARRGKDSRSSSRPPSSDPPWKGRPPEPPSGRRQGGQPGHAGVSRVVLEPERVDAVQEHWPARCPDCQAELPRAAAAAVVREQVWELPAARATVTEHRLQAVRCPGCQRLVRAARPADGGVGRSGPRLAALVGLLHGRYRLSARELAALVREVWEAPLGLGTVVGLWEQVGAALAPAQAEVQAVVAAAPQVNADETRWRQRGAKRWLWAATLPAASLFRVAASRAAAELEPLLGADFGGIVGSDRYRAYDTLPVERRQVCWAHLKRDLAGYSLYGGAVGAWGRAALAVEHAVFATWHRFHRGELDRVTLQQEAVPLQAALRALLEQGQLLGAPRGFCRELLRLWPALWTFLAVDGVEPTNNAAERALRPAVLWRKGCFGTQSEPGDRFAERLLTVAMTCRQQGRALWDFLTDTLTAHQTGQPVPSLFAAPA
jgi:transposase